MHSAFYITNNNDLKPVLKLIKKAKSVALDTEFTRQRTYYPILSLIQISVKDGQKQRSFIVDCLSDIDLKPLYKIISSKRVNKILHSALQDLQIFHHQSLKLPASVLDTQIMANMCGLDFNVGYSALVKKFFNEEIDKTQQRSNWQRRPLTQEQINYALSDVLYLEELHEKMFDDIKKQGRKKWLLEEMKIFAKEGIVKSDENLFKNFSFRKKNLRQIAKTKALVLWREQQAKQLDIPRQHVIKDEVIENIVAAKSIDIKLHSRTYRKVKEVLQHQESEKELELVRKTTIRNPSMNLQQREMHGKAKSLVAGIATREGVKEQFLISAPALKDLIVGNIAVKKSMSKWRYDLFGKDLHKIIKN